MIDLSIAWHCLQSHIQRPSRCSCLEKGHIPPGNAVVFLTIENTGNSINELPQKIIPGKLRRPLACDTQHNKLQHLLLTIAAIDEACPIAPSQSNSPSAHQGPQSSPGVARTRGERTCRPRPSPTSDARSAQSPTGSGSKKPCISGR